MAPKIVDLENRGFCISLIASQYLHKGEKAYFQGRLQTRSFTGKDGAEKSVTEIIAEDMLMLSGRPQEEGRAQTLKSPAEPEKTGEEIRGSGGKSEQADFDVDPGEIPF